MNISDIYSSLRPVAAACSLLCMSLLIPEAAVAAGNDWMASLPDNTPVRLLSIPGAHDAATKGAGPLAETQKLDLAGLFDAGVRVFDLRPKYSVSSLTIYHGAIPTDVKMEDALTTLISKVKGTSEFVIISMRDEDSPDHSKWAEAMSTLFTKYDADIATWQKGITVADARGKIILLCRDDFGSNKAGLVSGWAHNDLNKDAVISLGGNRARCYVQDNYDNPGDSKKKQVVKDMLDLSTGNIGKSAVQCWMINHTSYAPGLLNAPSSVAKSVNEEAVRYLEESAAGPAGLFLMDFAGDDSYSGKRLVDAVIEQNHKYLKQ